METLRGKGLVHMTSPHLTSPDVLLTGIADTYFSKGCGLLCTTITGIADKYLMGVDVCV